MKKAFVAEVVSNETSFVEEKINQHKSEIKVIAKMVLKDPDGTEYTYNKNSGVSYLKKAGDKILMIKNEDGSVYFYDSDQEYLSETKKRSLSERTGSTWTWMDSVFVISFSSVLVSSVLQMGSIWLNLGAFFTVFIFLMIFLGYTYKKSNEYSVDEEGRKVILDYINSERNEDGSVKVSEIEKDLLVEKEEYLMAR